MNITTATRATNDDDLTAARVAAGHLAEPVAADWTVEDIASQATNAVDYLIECDDDNAEDHDTDTHTEPCTICMTWSRDYAISALIGILSDDVRELSA